MVVTDVCEEAFSTLFSSRAKLMVELPLGTTIHNNQFNPAYALNAI
jgi:hypothetical protein